MEHHNLIVVVASPEEKHKIRFSHLTESSVLHHHPCILSTRQNITRSISNQLHYTCRRTKREIREALHDVGQSLDHIQRYGHSTSHHPEANEPVPRIIILKVKNRF